MATSPFHLKGEWWWDGYFPILFKEDWSWDGHLSSLSTGEGDGHLGCERIARYPSQQHSPVERTQRCPYPSYCRENWEVAIPFFFRYNGKVSIPWPVFFRMEKYSAHHHKQTMTGRMTACPMSSLTWLASRPSCRYYSLSTVTWTSEGCRMFECCVS